MGQRFPGDFGGFGAVCVSLLNLIIFGNFGRFLVLISHFKEELCVRER